MKIPARVCFLLDHKKICTRCCKYHNLLQFVILDNRRVFNWFSDIGLKIGCTVFITNNIYTTHMAWYMILILISHIIRGLVGVYFPTIVLVSCKGYSRECGFSEWFIRLIYNQFFRGRGGGLLWCERSIIL